MKACILALVTIAALHAQDVQDILRSYTDHYVDGLRSYTYQQRIELQTCDRAGAVTRTEVRVSEVQLENNRRTIHVFDENHQPAPEASKKSSPARWQTVSGLQCPSGKQIANKYTFQMEGTEQVDGRSAWVIAGTRKKGALQSTVRIWVDQADYSCAKFQDEIVFKQGSMIGRFQLKRTLDLGQTRMPDGTWLPLRATMDMEQHYPPSGFRHNVWKTSY